MSPIEVADSPPCCAAVIHLTVPCERMREEMQSAIDELIATVTAQRIGPAGPMFSHHSRCDPALFDFDLGIPISSPVIPTGRVTLGELPAARVVRSVYTGPYDGLGEAWGAFMTQVQAAGHTLAGSFWERYLTHPDSEAEPNAYQTELNVVLHP